MQMPLVVTTASEYEAWMTEAMKKPFQAETPAEMPVTDTTATNGQAAVIAQAGSTN